MSHRNPEHVQKKIELIEKGLPIDISEQELASLEDMLRKARGFSIDLLQRFQAEAEQGKNMDTMIAEESRNLAGCELALRKIDDFREAHRKNITQ